jgi:tetratricopeptide (TPR) repeat protein
MPLQPAPSATTASNPATRNHFQFHFTRATIEAVMGFAIKISGRFWFMFHSTIRTAIGFAAILATVPLLAADNPFAVRAEHEFQQAQQLARKEPTNVTALIQFARAAFDWAEFAREDSTREDIALRGIEAARAVINREPTNAAAHYWLGMDLSQLARTKTLGALKIVREIEEEFLRAGELGEHVDYAGPDRSLGFLYRDAPGWPASIGSKKKAREHLERAVKLHPEFPDNQLALLESFEKWADRQNFDRQLKETERVMAEAKNKFTGPAWESSWADWNARLREIKSKAAAVGKPVPSKGGK